jgi:hypothetical protein
MALPALQTEALQLPPIVFAVVGIVKLLARLRLPAYYLPFLWFR